MLSARELNSESLPNRNWINERLTFTHGYGVTLGPVNQVTPEGLPVLFIRDLPPQSNVDLTIDEPSIYYGQLSNDHVFVKTRAREFHYPRGDDNVYTSYEGTGGVPLSSFFRKALFSFRFRSFKTLLSEDITTESRVMFYRRLSERVGRIAPFLRYDGDPYLVISNGRLVWVQDAYTVTGRYPYSTPAPNGINYIRNSVKATVDAFHGTVRFYLLDDKDPIAQTYRQAFPDLFVPMSEMPEDMRTRLRYPEGIFAMQAAVYATYHMTNPSVFYNKEDLWEVPAIDADPRPQMMQPYYTVMRLPGEPQAEFIQMLPFTPARKDNLASWMVARSDGDNYGRMMVFQFPKQKVVFGPRQVVARINQDQVISPQITLWNQQGSEVLQGTLLVIPIEESLIYIRPLYLRVGGRPHPRAEARHRRLPESHRHGGDARRRAQPSVPAARIGAAARGGRHAAGQRAESLRRRPKARTNCRHGPWITTAAPSRRSARATGRCTVRRSAGWARCSTRCGSRGGNGVDRGHRQTRRRGDSEHARRITLPRATAPRSGARQAPTHRQRHAFPPCVLRSRGSVLVRSSVRSVHSRTVADVLHRPMRCEQGHDAGEEGRHPHFSQDGIVDHVADDHR